MSNQKGYFITIEGIEGVGKSTASQFIRQLLQSSSIPFVTTREPGGTLMAEDIRHVLLKNYEEKVSSMTELLLLFAGRMQNISQVILPALANGQWVVADRFTDASFAYQGGGRGVDQRKIQQLAEWVQGSLQPDLTILLDAPVALALERLQGRGVKDRIEQEEIDFFERIRSVYLHRARENSRRFRIVNASEPLNMVRQNIREILQPLIEQSKLKT